MSAEPPRGPSRDGISREALRGFLLRLALLGGIALAPAVAGTAAVSAGNLTLALSVGCLVSLVRALALGQRVAVGPLNHWDEALIFAALSRATHMLQYF